MVVNPLVSGMYEKLDVSVSGIAEWLIPLVYGGNCSKIYWIKREWCHQFVRDEVYDISVGEVADGDGGVKVFCGSHGELSYYLDDDCYVPSKNMLGNCQELEWHVGEIEMPKNNRTKSYIKTIPLNLPLKLRVLEEICRKEKWELDICLDYFICLNPFTEDVGSEVGEKLRLVVDEVSYRKLVNKKEADGIRLLEKRFTFLVGKLLRYGFPFKDDVTDSSTSSNDLIITDDELSSLCNLYPKKEDGKQYLLDLFHSINTTTLKPNQTTKDVFNLCIELLPTASLPNSTNLTSSSIKTIDETAREILDISIPSFLAFLQSIFLELDPTTGKRIAKPPGLITVARSAIDGFTPLSVVEELQGKVLAGVERIIFEAFGVEILVRRDYGEFICGFD